MARKVIRTDVFAIEGEADFGEALIQAHRKKSPSVMIGENAMRLRAFEKDGDLLVGDILRIRLDEPALLANLDGSERDATTDDNEGIGLANAFVYCPKTKRIAFQRNRTGVPLTKLAHYVQHVCELNQGWLAMPELVPSKMRELMRSGSARKLQFRVATPKVRPESVDSESLASTLHAAEKLEAPMINVEFSLGNQRKGSMQLREVVRTVKSLLRLKETEHRVDMIRVVTKDGDDDAPHMLDFIDAQVSFEKSIEASKVTKTFWSQRRDCVMDAWLNWKLQS
jgi:hypothetical protein